MVNTWWMNKLWLGEMFGRLLHCDRLSLPGRLSLPTTDTLKTELLIPKTIGNRKRDCAWGCAGVKKLKKNQLLSTNHQNPYLLRLVMICAQQLIFFNFLTPAHPHAQSLFLFPIVFGINLIEFFDVSKRWPLREGRDGKCEGGNDKCEFLASESANLSPILARQWWRHFRLWWPLCEGRDGKCEGGNDKCEFLARESANLSPILARQWWRHFRLTTSVSLLPSLSLSHRLYLTHNIGSASALPIILDCAWHQSREQALIMAINMHHLIFSRTTLFEHLLSLSLQVILLLCHVGQGYQKRLFLAGISLCMATIVAEFMWCAWP